MVRFPEVGALLLPLALLLLGLMVAALLMSLTWSWAAPTRTPVMRKRRWAETWGLAVCTATSQLRHSRARSSTQKK
jgi:hypothetical protein